MTEASVTFTRCKSLQSVVENFVQNESKLHLALTHVISSLTSTIASLQEIVNIVEPKSDSSKSECFQKILSHYTQILSTVSCLESSLAINVLINLHKENEDFKKSLHAKEKSNSKKLKKIKSNIKKRKDEIVKLRKKIQKKKTPAIEESLEKTTRQLYNEYKDLGDHEEIVLKDIEDQENTYLVMLLKNFKNVLKEEYKLLKGSEIVSSLSMMIDSETMKEINKVEDDNESKMNEVTECFESKKTEPEPDVIERPQSANDTSMGSRAGSFLSLSSFASYSFKEENSSKDGNSYFGRKEVFTTVKRCPSPFGKLGNQELPRRREQRRKYDPSRPPLPPLPPVQVTQVSVPKINSPLNESLTNLRQKLDEISGFHDNNTIKNIHQVQSTASRLPPLVPRSAYVEDNTMKELHQKLVSLTSPEQDIEPSPTSTCIVPVTGINEEIVENNSVPSSTITFDSPVLETQEEDGVSMRVTRSKSFIGNQQNISHQINRSASVRLHNFHPQPRPVQPVLPFQDRSDHRDLITTNIQQHIDFLNQHQMSVMKLLNSDQSQL